MRLVNLKLIVVLLISGAALAQRPSPSGIVTNQPSATIPGSPSHYLHITISPSTTHIIEGAVYGLDAEIENTSNLPVTINFSQTQLTVQPELAPSNVSCTWFYDTVSNDNVPTPLVLQPGDHFTVFFDTGAAAEQKGLRDNPQCKTTYWGSVRKRLDFVPGNYSFVMTGSFSTPPVMTTSGTAQGGKPPEATAPDNHYFTETAILPVTIDQSQIILYAGLGGLLAFLVTRFRSEEVVPGQTAKSGATVTKSRVKRTAVVLRSASAAVLVSVTVTVIASRLSTTSFPVKVSVEDFWGALTVGFVSYFVGGKFIDKLSDTFTSRVAAPATGAAPAAPATGAAPAAPATGAAPAAPATGAAPAEENAP
jgi:hypothetical protein